MKKMKAVLLTEPGKLSFIEREIPQIQDNEVLVKILHVGICGSDLHYYEHGRIGDFVVTKPIILGHEAAGVIEKIGKKVKSLKEGDLVAIEPGIPCGKCFYCKTGRYNLCPDMKFLATPPYDGAFVEYLAYPEDMCFKIPTDMDTIEGALIEPLSVGFHATNQANAQIGESAVILGAGTIGLMTLMVLLAKGLREIYISDIVDLRLEKAKEIGAKEVFNVTKYDIVDEIKKFTNGEGVDIVFETAGSEVTIKQTVNLVKPGGRIISVGMSPNPKIEYDFGKLQAKEAVINTVFRYRNIYPFAIKAVSEKMIDVKKIVTDTFGFSEIPDAFKYNLKNKSKTVKIVIDMNK